MEVWKRLDREMTKMWKDSFILNRNTIFHLRSGKIDFPLKCWICCALLGYHSPRRLSSPLIPSLAVHLRDVHGLNAILMKQLLLYRYNACCPEFMQNCLNLGDVQPAGKIKMAVLHWSFYSSTRSICEKVSLQPSLLVSFLPLVKIILFFFRSRIAKL